MNMVELPDLPPYVTEYAPSPAQGEVARLLARIEHEVFVRQYRLRPVPPPFDELPPPIAQRIASRWREPCEAAFEYLAEHSPPHLLQLIERGKLDAADLTFAAEIAGRVADSVAVRHTLLALLSHPEAVVREGAIYGLARHLDSAVRQQLSELAAKDPSAAVRTAAADALDEP